jgi:hypothetical protein
MGRDAIAPVARAAAAAAAIGCFTLACGSKGSGSPTDSVSPGLDATAGSAASSGLHATADASMNAPLLVADVEDSGMNVPSSFEDGGDSGVPQAWDPASCVPIGPTPVALASGLNWPIYGFAVATPGLEVDANNVYWIDTAVRSAAIDGGGVTVLASSIQLSSYLNASIAIDETNVYWNNAFTVMSVPKQGGATANLTDGTLGPLGEYAAGLVIRGTSAVWAWGFGALKGPYGGGIVETPLDGGASVLLFDRIGALDEMTADDSGIYYAGPDLWALPAAGGDAGASIPTATDVDGIAIDAQRIVWTSYDNGGAVESAPRDGGATVTLATGGWVPGAVVLDGSTVYWTIAAGNWPAPGAIMRANLDGTDAVILACDPNTPAGIAVDATSVYWISSGADGGAVYRLTPK